MLNSYRPTTWLPEWQEHHRYNLFSVSSAGEMPGTKHATLCCLHIFQQFDTVSRQGLWQVLRMFSCPEKFINLIASLHDGMQAQVSYGNTQSKKFLVSTGVKQGCVLAPTLFSFYLSSHVGSSIQEYYRRSVHTNQTQCRAILCVTFQS